MRFRWVSAAVLASFAAGCFVSARLVQRLDAQTENKRVFELLIYHTRPGKGPELEEGDPAWADTFVYLVAHPSQDDAKKRWDAIHSDPAMQLYIKEAATKSTCGPAISRR